MNEDREAMIPADATNLEVFHVRSCVDSPSGYEAYIGFKLPNGDFHTIGVPYNGPKLAQ